MATLAQRLKNAFRPLKRIRKEIEKLRNEVRYINAETITRYAYTIMRDLDLVSKDKNLLSFYLKISDRINICNNFKIMQRYLNATRPVRVGNLVRVGGANDGGYVMINPKIDLLRTAKISESKHDSPPPQEIDNKNSIDFSNPPFALSLGVSPYSPWDLDMANFGYKVLQYDASIAKAPYNHQNITFHKKFVGAKDNADTIAFARIIAENNLSQNACNVLQCDIEDCEWEILEQVDLGEMAKYFPQVLFEFHNCNPNDEKLSQRRLAVLEKLREYYTPIHTHFNCTAVYYGKGIFWCLQVEVTYLRNDLIDKEAKLLFGVGNSHLDSAYEKHLPDIPVIFDEF